jgi:branched-chain amino acid aminotransferase
VSLTFNTNTTFFISTASKLTVEKTTAPKPLPAKEGLAFGREFADHMLEVDWDSKQGWGTPRITPYGVIPLSPAAMVFHYALECFEGMKAYKDKDGNIRLFRPDCNMARLNDSLRRLYMPEVDGEQVTELIKSLLRLDQRWVPEGDGFSLYLRPTAIATDPFLGVSVADECKLFVITSPVGPYYPEGFKPIKLLADDKNVRAWPGGSGGTKLGANYGPTIAPAMAANDEGCAQVPSSPPEQCSHHHLSTPPLFFCYTRWRFLRLPMLTLLPAPLFFFSLFGRSCGCTQRRTR